MAQTYIDPAGQPIGRAGQLINLDEAQVDSGVNAEASLSIPFGVAVKRDSTNGSGRAFLLPTATSDAIAGLSVFSYNHSPGTTGDLDSSGDQKIKAALDILREGRALVTVEEAVSVDDRGYVRAVAGAGGSQLGAWRKSAVSSETIDVTKNAKFITSAAAAGLAVVEVNFTVKS